MANLATSTNLQNFLKARPSVICPLTLQQTIAKTWYTLEEVLDEALQLILTTIDFEGCYTLKDC